MAQETCGWVRDRAGKKEGGAGGQARVTCQGSRECKARPHMNQLNPYNTEYTHTPDWQAVTQAEPVVQTAGRMCMGQVKGRAARGEQVTGQKGRACLTHGCWGLGGRGCCCDTQYTHTPDWQAVTQAGHPHIPPALSAAFSPAISTCCSSVGFSTASSLCSLFLLAEPVVQMAGQMCVGQVQWKSGEREACEGPEGVSLCDTWLLGPCAVRVAPVRQRTWVLCSARPAFASSPCIIMQGSTIQYTMHPHPTLGQRRLALGEGWCRITGDLTWRIVLPRALSAASDDAADFASQVERTIHIQLTLACDGLVGAGRCRRAQRRHLQPILRQHLGHSRRDGTRLRALGLWQAMDGHGPVAGQLHGPGALV